MIAGTDPALYLGMITIILENEWYNEPYLKANTSMPFLVKRSDGSLLRERPAVDGKQAGDDNPFMVWDGRTGSLAGYRADGVDPVLDFETSINGEEFVTVFDC